MKYVAIVITLIALTGCGHVKLHPWTKADKIRQAGVAATMAVDMMQTRYIFDSPNYYETNPLIKERYVNLYFPVMFALHTGVAWVLPPSARKWWQYGWIGAQTAIVIKNKSIGIGMK